MVLSTTSAVLANKIIQEGLGINYALHTAVIFQLGVRSNAMLQMPRVRACGSTLPG